MFYEVLLGIDHAARDTKRRMRVKVEARDRLEAAIVAERIGDRFVREPVVEYTHAMRVWPLRKLATRPWPLTWRGRNVPRFARIARISLLPAAA